MHLPGLTRRILCTCVIVAALCLAGTLLVVNVVPAQAAHQQALHPASAMIDQVTCNEHDRDQMKFLDAHDTPRYCFIIPGDIYGKFTGVQSIYTNDYAGFIDVEGYGRLELPEDKYFRFNVPVTITHLQIY